MYFDGLKTHEGSRVGCILIDPQKNKKLITCQLELECMNNIAEYEELILGLKKAINLKVEVLKVISD